MTMPRLLTPEELPAFMAMMRREVPKRAELLPCQVHYPDLEAYCEQLITQGGGVVFWTDSSFLIGGPARSPYNALSVCGVVIAWGCSNGKDGIPCLRAFEDWCRANGIPQVETHFHATRHHDILDKWGYEYTMQHHARKDLV